MFEIYLNPQGPPLAAYARYKRFISHVISLGFEADVFYVKLTLDGVQSPFLQINAENLYVVGVYNPVTTAVVPFPEKLIPYNDVDCNIQLDNIKTASVLPASL